MVVAVCLTVATGCGREGARSDLTEIAARLPAVSFSDELPSTGRAEALFSFPSEAEDPYLHLVSDAEIIGDSLILVGTQNQVHAIDVRGTFLGTLGREGQGPGEFEVIRYINAVNDSTISIWDPGAQRSTVMTMSGSVVATRSIGNDGDRDFAPRDLVGTGPFLVTVSHGLEATRRTGDRQPRLVRLVDSLATPLSVVGEFAGAEAVHIGNMRFINPAGPRLYLATTDSSVLVGDGISPNIVEYSGSGVPQRSIRLPVEVRPIDRAGLEAQGKP